MISIHKLLTVALYEMRTLLRGWFFRIFAGLSILIIGIFNIAANMVQSGAPFIYRALPASLPYTNLLILNLGQAIVAVFLASEFLKQDRKNDTVEVIYTRSMTNAEYIIGKALGVISVFLILNLIILTMGIGFSFLSGDATQGIFEYLYYPTSYKHSNAGLYSGLVIFPDDNNKKSGYNFYTTIRIYCCFSILSEHKILSYI